MTGAALVVQGDALRLPTRPLRQAIETAAAARGQSVTQFLFDLDHRIPHAQRQAVRLFSQQTLNRYTADRWAVALGLHPIQIWPEWTALAEVRGR